jgi:hypothetical protein
VRHDLMAEGVAQPVKGPFKGLTSWFRHWEIPPAPAATGQPLETPE